jgi:hypothetical protein
MAILEIRCRQCSRRGTAEIEITEKGVNYKLPEILKQTGFIMTENTFFCEKCALNQKKYLTNVCETVCI